jgi:hypothetical protein
MLDREKLGSYVDSINSALNQKDSQAFLQSCYEFGAFLEAQLQNDKTFDDLKLELADFNNYQDTALPLLDKYLQISNSFPDAQNKFLTNQSNQINRIRIPVFNSMDKGMQMYAHIMGENRMQDASRNTEIYYGNRIGDVNFLIKDVIDKTIDSHDELKDMKRYIGATHAYAEHLNSDILKEINKLNKDDIETLYFELLYTNKHEDPENDNTDLNTKKSLLHTELRDLYRQSRNESDIVKEIGAKSGLLTVLRKYQAMMKAEDIFHNYQKPTNDLPKEKIQKFQEHLEKIKT